MKQLFLIGLLVLLAATQMTVTPQGICSCQQLVYSDDCNNMPGCTWNTGGCVQQTCSNYTVQSDCLKASKYCQWNSGAGTCGTFTGCANIQITTSTQYKQCISTNVQCAAYDGTSCQQLNTLTTQCSNYQNTYCNENVGTDGVCLWTTATLSCSPITMCSQAQKASQCQLLNDTNGLACQWTADPGTCTQITSCNAFTTSTTCKYYFPSLTSPNMILCQWNGTTCVTATNSRYLTNTNCLTGTGYNYRWISTASDETQGICASCKTFQVPSVTVFSRSQCQCSQYVLQADCNTTYCQWSTTSSTCSAIACTSVKSQSICASLQGCYWDYSNKGGCTSFGDQTCANLPTAINSIACAAQSIYCAGFSGGQCSAPTSTCSAALTQQGCQNWVGTDGVCKWAGGVCAPLKQCEQILDAVYCGSWQKQCSWNAENQLCQQFTCADNLTAATCTYVVTGFQQSTYQLCRYNQSNSACENASSGLLLTAKTCASNTASTYRWSTNSQSVGMCVSCGQNSLVLSSGTSCQCAQFTNQSDCNNSGYCTYSTSTCVPSTCSSITNQLTCASLPSCSWTSTGCIAFTGCSTLTANNQLECVAQNAQCKGYVAGTTAGTAGSCATSASVTCSTYTATTCTNSIGSDGVCYWNGQGCVAFSSCTGASQALCEKNPFACYWNATGKTAACQAQTCSNFTTQLNCKFYVPSPVSSQVIPCTWSNNACSVANEVLTQLTSSTCVANTHSTYRWVSNSTSGYCVRCQQQISLRNQCPCSYLLTASDCGQALECSWTQNGCTPLACSSIYLQSVCATQATCAWYGGACVNFSTLPLGCGSLTGTTQMQCVAQQSSCIGTTGTVCTNILSTCEASASANGCIDQFGSDGACYWESVTKKCLAVTSCSELSESNCYLKSHACIYANKKCQTLTCSQLTSSTCTFVVSLTNQNKVQTCQLVDDLCVNTTDSFELNSDNCYSNSARTSRWIPISNKAYPNITGICQSCSRSLVPVYNTGRCQCYQFLTQADCENPINSCSWNGYCSAITCSNITSQFQCAQTIGCGWTITENTVGTCGDFTACNLQAGKSLASCLAYSVTCRGYNGTNCTSEPSTPCSTYSNATLNYCNDNIGNDGLCMLVTTGTTSSCQAFNTCTQINNVNICTFYTNACVWTGTPAACAAVTCASLTTPATCNYVITSLTTGAIQLCQWNSSNKSCSNLNTFANQNQSNCASSSAFTYRWVPRSLKNTTTEGYCASCVVNYVFAPGQCACNQVFSQNECQQNPNCLWNSRGACQSIACSEIKSQLTCATNPRCAWSAATQVCQPFTGCGDLAGVNAYECMSYSAYCGAINQNILFNLKYACATPPTACEQPASITNGTTVIENPAQCENTIIQGGICLWQTTTTDTTTTSSCVTINSCSQITSQSVCLNLIHTCYWGTAKDAKEPTCQQTSCTNLSRVNCNYYYTNLGAPSSANINYCTWTVGNGCGAATATTTQTLTQENCYSTSLMMYRWSSTISTKGFCASCTQFAASSAFKAFCSCSVLSQTECSLAAPQCSWNGTACAEQACTSIKNLKQCALLEGCQVVNGGCVAFTNCNLNTTATTPLQCLEFSVKCPVYTAGNASPCTATQKCSSFTTSDACATYNSQVATGLCSWNGTTSKCETINNCAQITEVALCGLQTNRCQWSGIFNSCITQTCSSYTSQATCTFIYTSYTPGDIALCQWNTSSMDCRSAPLSSAASLSGTECFVNTGHTYHLDGTSCVQCFQMFLSALFVILLMLA